MARSYQQHCGLAVALDLTARRWTLLIVRDLEPGPRRFTDLFDGLPGISTDLLADRLRDLQAAGAVEHRVDPDRGNVYQLTDRGRDLADICHGLARWGMPLLPPVAETPHRTNVRWALQTMAANAPAGLAPRRIHVDVVGNEPLTLAVDPDGARLHYGHDGTADLTVRFDPSDLMELLAWSERETGDPPVSVAVEGSLDDLRAVLSQLPLLLEPLDPVEPPASVDPRS